MVAPVNGRRAAGGVVAAALGGAAGAACAARPGRAAGAAAGQLAGARAAVAAGPARAARAAAAAGVAARLDRYVGEVDSAPRGKECRSLAIAPGAAGAARSTGTGDIREPRTSRGTLVAQTALAALAALRRAGKDRGGTHGQGTAAHEQAAALGRPAGPAGAAAARGAVAPDRGVEAARTALAAGAARHFPEDV